MARGEPIVGNGSQRKLTMVEMIENMLVNGGSVALGFLVDYAGNDPYRGISLTPMCDLHHLIM